MTLINRGFLAVGDMAFFYPFADAARICACFFFNDAAVTEAYIITSCRISA